MRRSDTQSTISHHRARRDRSWLWDAAVLALLGLVLASIVNTAGETRRREARLTEEVGRRWLHEVLAELLRVGADPVSAVGPGVAQRSPQSNAGVAAGSVEAPGLAWSDTIEVVAGERGNTEVRAAWLLSTARPRLTLRGVGVASAERTQVVVDLIEYLTRAAAGLAPGVFDLRVRAVNDEVRLRVARRYGGDTEVRVVAAGPGAPPEHRAARVLTAVGAEWQIITVPRGWSLVEWAALVGVLVVAGACFGLARRGARRRRRREQALRQQTERAEELAAEREQLVCELADTGNRLERVSALAASHERHRRIAYSLAEDARHAQLRAERAEVGLREQAERLAQANRNSAEIAYATAHYMQTPLRTMVHFLEFAMADHGARLDAGVVRFLQHAVDGGLRMKAMLDGVMRCMEAAEGKPLSGWVDLRAMFVEEAQRRGVCVLDGPCAPAVWADAGLLRVLVRELVDNSVRHAGVEPRLLQLSAESDTAGWRFRFSDADGELVESEDGASLVGMFRQADRSDDPGSVGLGLALARRIMEVHGGRLVFAPGKRGGGCTVLAFPAPGRPLLACEDLARAALRGPLDRAAREPMLAGAMASGAGGVQ